MAFRALAVLSLLFSCFSWAAPITFDIICGGVTVGVVSVGAGGGGVSGDFTSSVGGPPTTLAAAAAQCGEHHFNWYQIVSGTHPLIPGGGPQVDPQPGGQGGQWADNLPWYWDETSPPNGTPGFEPGLQLGANTTASQLHFEDFPNGPNGTSIMFMTWLVSLNADGSFHSWHEGFSWTWMRAANGTVTVGDPVSKGPGVFPTTAQYGDLITGFATSVPEPQSALCFLAGLAACWALRGRSVRF